MPLREGHLPRPGVSFTVQVKLSSWMWNSGPHQPLWSIVVSCVMQIPGMLTGCMLTCVYIYLFVKYAFFKRQRSKSCSSSVLPSPQLQLSGGCRCLLAKVWPAANRSEGLKVLLLACCPCACTPSSAAVSLRRDARWVADFCTEDEQLLLKSICLPLLLATTAKCPFC